MISIDVYRAAVGSFYSKISHASASSLINNGTPMSFLLAQIAMLAINLSFIIAILLVFGGVEQNPGPTFRI